MDVTLLYLSLAGLWAAIAVIHQFRNGSGMGAGGAVSAAWAIAALFFGIAAASASAWYWGCAVTVGVYAIYMRLINPAVDWLYYKFRKPQPPSPLPSPAAANPGPAAIRALRSSQRAGAGESKPDSSADKANAPSSSSGTGSTKPKHPQRKSRALRDREYTIGLILGFFFCAGMSAMFWSHFWTGIEHGILLFDWSPPRRRGGIGIDGLVFRALFAAMWDVVALLCALWLYRHRREKKQRAQERLARRAADRARNKHRLLD